MSSDDVDLAPRAWHDRGLELLGLKKLRNHSVPARGVATGRVDGKP